jgi:two-component system, LuxR family, response regulator FixJ
MLRDNRPSSDIFVIDDDLAIRDSLATALKIEGYGVETFEDGASFMRAAQARKPGAILLDVHMPGRSGLDILKDMKKDENAVPVIVITGHGDVPMAVEAIKAGAFDFIEKPFSFDALLVQLRAALDHGKTDAEPVDLNHAFGDTLTAREREVLREIASGASSKEAGRLLNISPRTVEVHRARIMRKLNARNAADLMRIVFSGPGRH